MAEYTLIDDGGWRETIKAESMEDACDQATDWLFDGDYSEDGSTSWASCYVHPPDGGFCKKVTIDIDPIEPICTKDDHDWQAPIELVGGIEENPGVQGHGGGVIIHEICVHCATHRRTDTWAQNPATGEQGLDSVSYEADHSEETADAIAEFLR